MEQVVIDANVLVKLFLDEDYSDNVLKLKEAYVAKRFIVCAPSIIIYELINTLEYKKFRGNDIGVALKTTFDYRFNIKEIDEELADLIADISVRYEITAYDASYLAVAMLENATLYTADSAFLKKVKKLELVKHIKEFVS